jgi:uncharacterized protein YdiU (UPF0061 family)
MTTLLDLNYVLRFQSLPSALYSDVLPQGIKNPKLVVGSHSTAALLGLNPETLKKEDGLKLLSGQGVLSTWQSIAMKYTGHQFGQYNPNLGDGRGVLLAQVEHNNMTWDMHLKGAGSTPYSRQGDGRAVLRSSIREFLASEALAALNIPTTRALCVIDSDTPVYREQQETAATIVRVAQSHIRFGHFEFCSFSNKPELLKTLCDYVIHEHYPELDNDPQKYLGFFKHTVQKTAELIAHWQSNGFAHGVMNTDNMSILGDTFDFGPFAFLDEYEPNFICNHSDYQGRYAFNQQPNIAHWNLSVLAQALLPLTKKDDLMQHLESFSDIFEKHFFTNMNAKFGFVSALDSHQDFIDDSLKMLASCKLDYSYFFRQLSNINDESVRTQIRNHCLDINLFDSWYTEYEKALIKDGQDQGEVFDLKRKTSMDKVNPKYILRNYLAQNAILAAQKGDYSQVQTLHKILCNPYDEQPEFEEYAQLPPDWGKKLEISCSS